MHEREDAFLSSQSLEFVRPEWDSCDAGIERVDDEVVGRLGTKDLSAPSQAADSRRTIGCSSVVITIAQ